MNIAMTLKDKLSDQAVMAGRCMRHAFRSIDTIITVVVMPVMMMLITVYVFGGAINTGSVNYIDYIAPGIILMGIVSGVAYEAFRLNNDIKNGIVDRFRSMPIAKSSILGGHVLSSVVFNAFSTVMIMLFALLIGFRAHADIIQWLGVVGMLLLFTFAMTWVAVFFGILASSAEGAGVFSYILLFMLFISSGFAPTASMPGIVRAFAENQPMTPIMDTIRALLSGGPAGSALSAVIWCVGILVVFYVASMQMYKRKTA